MNLLKAVCIGCLSALLLPSCGQQKQQTPKEEKSQMVGTTDASTGYTWSEVRGEKVRIFEVGARVLSATDPHSSLATYLVFAQDSSKVELFLPNEDAKVLERRQRPDGTAVWNVEDDDTYLVESVGKNWFVSRRGTLYYSTKGTEDRKPVTFTSADNQTIDAIFFTQSEVMQLTVNGMTSLLKQYRTASGYGYKNPLYDLRGKGKEATLTTLSDKSQLKLQEKE